MIKKDYQEYADTHSSPDSELLNELYRETYLKTVYPRMISGSYQGKVLGMISHMIRPKTILEIGTFTGYSTICLSQGLPKDGKIHTIEVNPEMQDIFMKYFRKASIENDVVVHTGPALEIIPQLDETFDLVFIDADKENYLNYYNLVFEKVRMGGFILADNAFWDGKVIREDHDKETRGITEFNEFVQNDPRVENVLLTIRDGLMLVRKVLRH